jgi:hypothetical protein
MVCGGLRATTIKAQTPSKAQAPSPTPRSQTTAGSATANDAAQRAQVLTSDRWKKVEQEFAKWLAVQVIYTPQQVAQLKAKLAAEVQRMSAPELEQFLDQWDAKLKVSQGKDAAEAREWLGQNLSVVADGYRPQLLKKLGITDLSNLTAAQIEDEITKVRSQRLTFQQQRGAFDVGRQQAVNMAHDYHTEEKAVLKESGVGQAAGYGTYQSQYTPRQYDYQPRPPIIPYLW